MTGDYDTPFTWLQCTRTPDGTTGAKPKTYSDNGTLWGALDITTANETTEWGATRNTVTAQARLRQLPDVSALDKLVDQQYGVTYFVTGVRRDRAGNELVCDLESYDGVA